ncbi:disulfide bond formation protein B, partial [Bacillus cereus group sp. BC303]|uniref:disulfide bond formation protein B n=1 Tax=Bacillus cereus group sp. BC303 TaxID=3445322 RepID=UPI003F1FFF7A
GKGLYGVLSLVAVGIGAFIAGRHVWLQGLPEDEVPSCGPGLDYMMDILPMQEVVAMVLTGSGECAEIDFMLLGLSLPGWTLLGFVILALV